MTERSVRTIGPVPAPNGANVVGPLLVPEGVRWIQLVQGAQADLVVWWEAPGASPGVDRRDGEQLERDGQVVYVAGRMERGVWIVFPASSLDTDPDVILRTSSDPWPFVDPGAPFPATQVVSLDYDDHLAEREDIAVSGTVSTSSVKVITGTETELTYPHKWRSVIIQVGTGSHNGAHVGTLSLLLWNQSSGRSAGWLGDYEGNSRGGGFPVMSMSVPNFDWALAVSNTSAVTYTAFGALSYSTNEPSR